MEFASKIIPKSIIKVISQISDRRLKSVVAGRTLILSSKNLNFFRSAAFDDDASICDKVNGSSFKEDKMMASGKMISSFVTVIEGTKELSLGDNDKEELVNAEGPVPVPAKCSAQLRKLLHSHSISKPPTHTVRFYIILRFYFSSKIL